MLLLCVRKPCPLPSLATTCFTGCTPKVTLQAWCFLNPSIPHLLSMRICLAVSKKFPHLQYLSHLHIAGKKKFSGWQGTKIWSPRCSKHRPRCSLTKSSQSVGDKIGKGYHMPVPNLQSVPESTTHFSAIHH